MVLHLLVELVERVETAVCPCALALATPRAVFQLSKRSRESGPKPFLLCITKLKHRFVPRPIEYRLYIDDVLRAYRLLLLLLLQQQQN